MISDLSPQRVGPFLIQRVRLDYPSAARHDVFPFVIKKDTLVLVTGGTLYTTVGDIKYAEAKGAIRYLRAGDRVYFTATKAFTDMFFEYAEFIMISGG